MQCIYTIYYIDNFSKECGTLLFLGNVHKVGTTRKIYNYVNGVMTRDNSNKYLPPFFNTTKSI